MRGDKPLFRLRILHQRKLGDPGEGQRVRVDPIQLFAQVQTQIAQRVAGCFGRVRDKEEDVAFFGIHGPADGGRFFGLQKLEDGGGPVGGIDLGPGQSFGAIYGDKIRQSVEVFPGKSRGLVGFDGFDDASGSGDFGEQLEARILHDGREVRDLHAEAHIGVVFAVAADGFGVRQPGKRKRQIDVPAGLENRRHQALHHPENVFFRDEGHFHVDLREFRLAVGAQILIAEAFDNLEITVKSGNHQELLENLRGLGKRVKHALGDAAGNEIIPRAFRCALGQEGRFHFNKSVVIEILPRGNGQPAAQEKVFLNGRPPQVQIAVFEPDIFRDVFIVKREGRCFGFVEDFQFGNDDFHLPGGKRRILHARRPSAHSAFHGQNVLAADFVRFSMDGFPRFGIKNNLNDALAIPEIDKNDAAVIAPPVHPSHQNDLPAFIGAG